MAAIPIELPPAAPASPGVPTGYDWYVVATLFAVSVLGYVDRVILSFLVEPIKADLALSDKQVGLVVGTAFAVLYVIGGIFLARVLDGRRRMPVLAACIIVWSAGTLVSGLAGGFALLFVARMLVGVGEAGLNPAAISIISDRFDATRVQRPLGLFTTGLYVGGGLAMMGGGKLLAELAARPPQHLPLVGVLEGWRMVFVLLAIPGVVLAVLLLATVRDRQRASPNAPAPAHGGAWRFVRANAALVTLLATSVVAWSMNNYGLLNWYPAMLMRSHGMTAQDVAWTYGPAFLLGGMAGCLGAAPVQRALARRFGMVLSPFALTLGCMATLAVTTFAGPLMPDRGSAVAFAAINMFVSAMSVTSVFILIVAVAPPRMRALFTGFYMALVNLTGGAFGSVLVGALTDNVLGAERLNVSLSVMAAVFGPLATVLMLFAIRIVRTRGIAAAG